MTIKAEHRDVYALEYQRIGAELTSNETMGDTRVTGFMSIWAAAVGGVAYVVTHPSEHALLRPMAIGAVLVLLLNGVIVLARIVKRNKATDRLKDSLEKFRSLLLGGDTQQLNAASPWRPPKPRRAFLHFGLLHVLYGANATSLALLAMMVPIDDTRYLGGICVLAYAFQVMAVQLAYDRKTEAT